MSTDLRNHVRVRSLRRYGRQSTRLPQPSLPDLLRGLLDELVIVLVLLGDTREGIVVVERAHLLLDHFVLGAIDVTLQEVAQVRVVVLLSVVTAEETGNLVLLVVLCIENRVVTRADATLVVKVL